MLGRLSLISFSVKAVTQLNTWDEIYTNKLSSNCFLSFVE